MHEKLRKNKVETPKDPIHVAIDILEGRIEKLSMALEAIKNNGTDLSIDTGIPPKETEGKDIDLLRNAEFLLRKTMHGEIVRDQLPKLAREYVAIASHLFNCSMMDMPRSGTLRSYENLENIIWGLEGIKGHIAKEATFADEKLN
jgi:hypothetical protein